MDNEPKNDFSNNSLNEPYAPRPIFSNETSDGIIVKKHSGLGIAALIIGIVGLVLVIFGSISGSSAIEQIASSDLVITDPNDTEAVREAVESLGQEVLVAVVAAATGLIGAGLLAFVGLILAIVAACSSKRRRLFGVIGIVLNFLVIAFAIGMFIAGIASFATSVA